MIKSEKYVFSDCNCYIILTFLAESCLRFSINFIFACIIWNDETKCRQFSIFQTCSNKVLLLRKKPVSLKRISEEILFWCHFYVLTTFLSSKHCFINGSLKYQMANPNLHLSVHFVFPSTKCLNESLRFLSHDFQQPCHSSVDSRGSLAASSGNVQEEEMQNVHQSGLKNQTTMNALLYVKNV